jgi:hypothetical protein
MMILSSSSLLSSMLLLLSASPSLLSGIKLKAEYHEPLIMRKVQIIFTAGEFIASHSSNYWEEGGIKESSQKEIEEHDEPLEYLVRELESIDVLRR